MAEYIEKAGSANAFKVEVKQEDWHSDFTGQIEIPENVVAGDKHYFGIRKMKAKSNGETYLRLSIGKKVQSKVLAPDSLGAGSSNPVNAGAGMGGFEDMDSDIPF
jgi:hypothetical protein